MSKKIGDVSRRRRLAGPARLAYYAWHRSRRFARRFGGPQDAPAPPAPKGTPAVAGPTS